MSETGSDMRFVLRRQGTFNGFAADVRTLNWPPTASERAAATFDKQSMPMRVAEIWDVPVNLPCWVGVLNFRGEVMIERLGLLSMVLYAVSVAPVRAADVTGNWRVTISMPDGTITGKASFKQTGHVVTGWVGPSESDPIPITGTLKGNKLTIKTSPQAGRTVAFDRCDVTVNGDKMAGTIDTDKGTIEFVKSVPTVVR